jgi:hypothetical protein
MHRKRSPFQTLPSWSVLALGVVGCSAHAQPIRLHPENPHYFEFRGKPTILITSGEHYGAVLNPDFDYVTYLDTLQAAGLNLTRVVNGSYLEAPNSMFWPDGNQNPLAPRRGRYLAPWKRSDQPGYFVGGNKFDLDHWDENYFRRLNDFLRAADERGVVVLLDLFYVLYGEGPVKGSWVIHPFHPRNNINGVGAGVEWHRFNTLDDPKIVALQEALVRKTVTEVNPFDNLYFLICCEPYWSGASQAATAAWQQRLVETVVTTEAKLPKRHLIAVGYENVYVAVESPHPAVSVLNFHYCSPPVTVPLNWHFNKPIAFDETEGCFDPRTIEARREAWAFMLSGGAAYNNLDASFATDDATGSGTVAQGDRSFDGRRFRAQLGVLKRFMDSLDFVHMRPNQHRLHPWPFSADSRYYVLEKPGEVYAVYFRGSDEIRRTTFAMDLPAGRWLAEWTLPADGSVIAGEPFTHPGGDWRSETPDFKEDIALRLAAIDAGSTERTTPAPSP